MSKVAQKQQTNTSPKAKASEPLTVVTGATEAEIGAEEEAPKPQGSAEPVTSRGRTLAERSSEELLREMLGGGTLCHKSHATLARAFLVEVLPSRMAELDLMGCGIGAGALDDFDAGEVIQCFASLVDYMGALAVALDRESSERGD